MRPAALLVASLLAGCVVDVDLGSTGAPDGPPPDQTVDALPLDAQADEAVQVADGSADLAIVDSVPDMGVDPDAAVMPDGGRTPEQACDECIAVLLQQAEGCFDPEQCFVDLDVVQACGQLCGAPEQVDICARCDEEAELIAQACGRTAGPDECAALGELIRSECSFGCGGSCAECVDPQLLEIVCAPDLEGGCAEAIVTPFAECIGLCSPESFECAFVLSFDFELCSAYAEEPCVGILGAGLEACIEVGETGWCLACERWLAVDDELCTVLGMDEGVCEARRQAVGRLCGARCAGEPFSLCQQAAAVEAAICESHGGVDCALIADDQAALCLAKAQRNAVPCTDCLAQALGNAGGFEGDLSTEFLLGIEPEWSACVAACGGQPSGGQCIQCAIDADAAMVACLARGDQLSACLSARYAADRDCEVACGSLQPVALPCEARFSAAFEVCMFADGDFEQCAWGAGIGERACYWARGGLD